MKTIDLKEKAIKEIFDTYLKILYVDFTTRHYEVVKIPSDEIGVETNSNIDTYWDWFCGSELIHHDDVAKVRGFISNNDKSVIYRRKFDDGYRFVVMSFYYNLLTVKEIDNIYKKELPLVVNQAQRIDGMTGCLNHKAFEEDIKKASRGNMGVLFADINGLKYANDNKGHKEGDKLILNSAKMLQEQFPAYNIYRIGGDEFVVVAFNVKSRVFIHTATSFHKRLWNDVPVMSIGYSTDIAEDVQEITEDAERQMYEDKEVFYQKYPQYKR